MIYNLDLYATIKTYPVILNQESAYGNYHLIKQMSYWIDVHIQAIYKVDLSDI